MGARWGQGWAQKQTKYLITHNKKTMAKKRVSGISGLDRAIKSTRTKISAKKKLTSSIKTAKKKKATLTKLQNQLKRMGGRTSGKRR